MKTAPLPQIQHLTPRRLPMSPMLPLCHTLPIHHLHHSQVHPLPYMHLIHHLCSLDCSLERHPHFGDRNSHHVIHHSLIHHRKLSKLTTSSRICHPIPKTTMRIMCWIRQFYLCLPTINHQHDHPCFENRLPLMHHSHHSLLLRTPSQPTTSLLHITIALPLP